MKKLITIGLLASMMACSTTKVSYDYDKQADFSQYQTYSYSEAATDLPIQELNQARLLRAIDQEMTARGFTKSESPDVLVDLHVRAEQKRDATATTTYNGGMYGNPWRWGYGGGFSTTQVNVNEYVEGTLFINVVDTEMEKIVWQGIGTKTLSEDISPEKREENINKAVSKIFENYPVPAAPNS